MMQTITKTNAIVAQTQQKKMNTAETAAAAAVAAVAISKKVGFGENDRP